MRTYRTSKLTAVALAIPLLLSALTACGTGDGAADPDSSADGGSDGTESTQSFDDYQLAFASCMREQGVDMPDPNPDGSIEAQSDDRFMEAAEVCQGEVGDPPAAPGGDGPEMSDEERQAEMLELTECFRDNGIDVADPQPGELPSIPMDVPDEVFEECAPNGFSGATGSGAN